MKIALDVSQMAYTGHGVARYTEELARALLVHSSTHSFTFYAGVLRRFSFFALRRRQQPWARASWRLFPLPPRLGTFLWNHTRFPFETLLGPHDLFHVSDWTHPYSRFPTFTTVHDLVFRQYPETVHPRVLAAQTHRLARAVAFGAHFLVDSHATKADLLKFYSLDESRVSVVYPGLSSHFVPASASHVKRVRELYHLPTRYLLTLGTREPRKNLPRLIQAHARLASQVKTTPPLVIAGRFGWGQDVSPSPHVILTGYLPDSDLPALYTGAAAFLYPSLYEGFGFPVLEAMACGAPVLTSNVSSLPEVAASAAILVTPTNEVELVKGIRNVLTASSRLRSLGFQQVRRFSWAKTAAATLAVYQQVLPTRRS